MCSKYLVVCVYEQYAQRTLLYGNNNDFVFYFNFVFLFRIKFGVGCIQPKQQISVYILLVYWGLTDQIEKKIMNETVDSLVFFFELVMVDVANPNWEKLFNQVIAI